MSFTCRDLLKLELFQKTIQFVAGEGGLDNPVTWTYMKHVPDLAPWVNGGELVFVLGNSKDSTENELLSLLQVSAEHKVAGVVFLCGNKIKKISNGLMKKANELSMPIFMMDYNVKLIDVTKEIASAILNSDNKERMIIDFMSDLVHQNFNSEETIMKQGYECGVNLDQDGFVMSISSNFAYEEKNYNLIMTYRNSMYYLLKKIEQIALKHQAIALTRFHVTQCTCYFCLDNRNMVHDMCNEIEEFMHYYFKYNEILIYCGCGQIYRGVSGTLKSLKESISAQLFAKKSQTNKYVYHYRNLGFLRIMVNSNSKAELLEYSQDVLSELIASDKNNQTEYLLTVRAFLENNNNLVRTAEVLFIHRNTLINRLEKIQKITKKDLGEASVKLEYLSAFQILDFYSEY